MKQLDSILDAIGNTPLVRLHHVTSGVRPKICAKLEFLNPGGSVKDRIGIAMVLEAEREGRLKPGGTIVEPTSGNTGVGLAMVAVLKGYKMIFTMPDKMSEEKRRLLRAYGAKVVITPTNVSPDSPEYYIRVAERITRETLGAFMPNQYVNSANPRIHYETTGPEIWEQTQGRVDIFVAGMGTGGTISGVGKYLKEQNPKVRVVGVDPKGSILASRFYRKEEKAQAYKVEGIGEDFIPSTLDPSVVDEVVTVADREALLMTRRLAQEEAIMAGGSSGAALWATLQVSKDLSEDDTVVVLFPDTGRNYLSKVFSDDWMIEHGFLDYARAGITVHDVLDAKRPKVPPIVSVTPEDSVAHAIELMRKYDISQLPVVIDDVPSGSVRESTIMQKLVARETTLTQPVKSIIEEPLPTVDVTDDVRRLYGALPDKYAAVVVRRGKAVGVLTMMDVINFHSQRDQRGKS